MAYNRTVWKDRLVQRPNTFTISNNPDGTVTLVPVPGTVMEPGTAINAAAMNKIELGIEDVNAQLAQKENILNVDFGELELPNDFPSLPFKLLAIDENTVEHDFDINEYKKGAGKVYVDFTQSNINLDGLTPQTPKKHLDRALTVAESLPQETVIVYLMNRYSYREYLGISTELRMTKNIIFAPYGNERAYLGNFNSPLSWSSDGTAYYAARSAVEKVLDLSMIYKGTEPLPYKKVDSVNEVKSEQGTWYTDGTNVWIRRYEDKVPDENMMVMVRVAPPSFDISGKKLIFDRVSFFWSQAGADSLRVRGDADSELVLYKSSFAHSSANGLSTTKVGRVYNVESKAYGNATDGFNYHGTVPMVQNPYELVYEYKTESFDNGTNGLDNNNASTAHEGINILRVNTLTYDTEGPIVADVNGCYSILINCISHSSRRNVSSRLKSAFFFNNTSAVKPGKAILINCGGGGKDTYALATDSGFDLQVRRFKGSNWWPEALDSVEFI